jgi:virginiamycin B lyase
MKTRRYCAALLVAAFALAGCQGATSTHMTPTTIPATTGHGKGHVKPHTVVSTTCTPPAGQTAGTITEYSIPTASTQPYGLVVDSSSNVWFGEYGNAALGELTSTHSWNQYSTPTRGSQPISVTIGSDGNPWFTEFATGRVGKFNTSTSTITEYAFSGGAGSYPEWIDNSTVAATAGMWLPLNGDTALAKLSTSGTISYSAAVDRPYGLSVDTSGNIWYTMYNPNKVTEETVGHTARTWNVPTSGSQPFMITEGPSGTGMWFTEYHGNKIANINSAGTLTEYAVPTASSEPEGIVAACGNIWFAEKNSSKIGELTPAGSFTEYSTPTAASGPTGLAVDANGNVWFTERNANKIAMIATTTGGPTAGLLAVFNGSPVHGVNGQITMFGPTPITSPTSEITNLPGATGDDYGHMTYDNGGDLWVGADGRITEYGAGASGNATPLASITPTNTISQVDGIAIDNLGNIYVADIPDQAIYVYAYGATGSVSPIRTISGALTGLGPSSTGLAIDSSENVWVGEGSTIAEFAQGADGNVAPINTVSGAATFTACGMSPAYDNASVSGLSFDQSGNLIVGMAIVGIADVFEYAPGSTSTTCPINATGAGAAGPPYDLAVDGQNFVYILINGFPVYVYTEAQLFSSGSVATVTDVTQISDPVAIAAFNPPLGSKVRRARGKRGNTAR